MNEPVYITKDGKRLRCGYTTGSCAAAASKAAAIMLLSGKKLESVWLMTPKNIGFTLELENVRMEKDRVSCAVRKDSGDDPDITNGILIFAQVSLFESDKFAAEIDGGVGVGRVTKPGLDQPVGSAAINSTPRRMIAEELRIAAEEYGYSGGIRAVISIPEGERLAQNTFNPRLGIVGGLSILGTTGVVEPMSDAAIVDTIRAELSMLHAAGKKYALLTPGNYGEAYIREYCTLDADKAVKTSNFIGDSLDIAAEFGFEGVLLVGHIGKLVKLAGGLYNTHSRWGDCRAEIFAAHTALCGGSRETAIKIMNSVMTDDMTDIVSDAGIRDEVMNSITDKIAFYLDSRVHSSMRTEVIMFSNKHGLLAKTKGAEELAALISAEN